MDSDSAENQVLNSEVSSGRESPVRHTRSADIASDRYAGHVLDIANGQLLAPDGKPVHLRVQSMRLLVELARASPNTVRQKDLFDNVWAGRCVTADSLVQCVSDIRRKIGDHDKSVLVTIHRVGYKLIPDPPESVSVQDNENTGTAVVPAHGVPPFIGLDSRDLAETCNLRLSRLLQRNTGGFLLVSGARGSGRSYLVNQLLDTARQAGVPVACCQADQHEPAPGRSVMCWVRELNRSTDILDNPPAESPDAGYRLDDWSSVGTPSEFGRLQDVEDCLCVLSENRTPVVLCLDNIQWSDTQSLALLAQYGPALARASILIVATALDTGSAYQPIALRQMMDAYLDEEQFYRCALPAVTRADVAQLANGLSVPVPKPEILDALLSYTGGNLRYLIECLEAGVVPHTADKATGRAAEIPIPDALLVMVDKRFGQLNPHEEDIVGILSCASGRIPLLQIREMLNKKEPNQHYWLEALIGRDWLVLEHGYLSMKIPLEADAVVRCLAGPTLRRVRRLLAHLLLSRRPVAMLVYEPGADWIAGHGQNGFEKVSQHYQHAVQARSDNRPHEEKRLLEKALESLGDLPVDKQSKLAELELLYDLGLVNNMLDGWGASSVREAWSRAYKLASQIGSPDQKAKTLNALDTYYRDSGNWALCEQMSSLGQHLVATLDDKWMSLKIRSSRAAMLLHTGQINDALKAYDGIAAEYAESVAQTTNWYSHTHLIGAWFRSAQCYWLLGDLSRVELNLQMAQSASEKSSQPFHRAITLFHVALVYEFAGDNARVMKFADRLKTLSLQYDFGYYQLAADLFTAFAKVRMSSCPEAFMQMQSLTKRQFDTGTLMFEPYWRANLACAMLRFGQAGEALEELERALVCSVQKHNRFWDPELLRLKAECLQKLNTEESGIIDLYRQSMALAEKQGSKALAQRAARSLAQIQNTSPTGDTRVLLLSR